MTIARTPENQDSNQACRVNRTPAWDHKSLEKVGSVWMWQERKDECGAHTIVVCRSPHPHRPPHQQRVFPRGRSSVNSCSMKNFGKVLDSKRLKSGYNHVPVLCTVVAHLIPIHHASASLALSWGFLFSLPGGPPPSLASLLLILSVSG